MDSGHQKVDISIDPTWPRPSAAKIAKILINLKLVIVVARNERGLFYSTANNTRSIVFCWSCLSSRLQICLIAEGMRFEWLIPSKEQCPRNGKSRSIHRVKYWWSILT